MLLFHGDRLEQKLSSLETIAQDEDHSRQTFNEANANSKKAIYVDPSGMISYLKVSNIFFKQEKITEDINRCDRVIDLGQQTFSCSDCIRKI